MSKEIKYNLTERLPLNRVAFPASYTPAERTAARLSALNPAIKDLISRLSLVDENKMPVAVITGDQLKAYDITTLEKIAGKALNSGQDYSKEEVIELISTHATVSQERALNGFNKMVSFGIIEASKK